MDTARRDILEKLKKASFLKSSPAKPDFSKNTYHPLKRELSAVFIQNLELLKGEAHIFKTEEELFSEIKKLINKNNWEQICCREEKLRAQLITAQVPIIKCENLPKKH